MDQANVEPAWLTRLAAACARTTEAEVVAAVRPLLGDRARVATWHPGRGAWDRQPGSDPIEVPAVVPDPDSQYADGGMVIALAGSDATAARLLVLEAPALPAEVADAVAALVAGALGRLVTSDVAEYTRQRLSDNERIGRLGSYDWHVPTDTNRWSDELYRIYGEAPQSFNASYDRFIEYIHPDDRAKVRGIHEQAFATGEPYEMEERIVLADGSQRLLWSNGEVIRGADGTPQRFIGICRDVTQERAAERAAAEADELRQAGHDAEIRRLAALEVNDSVVQGLTSAAWAFEIGADEVARTLVDATLESARSMMNDLLAGPRGAPVSGGLRRTVPPEGHISDRDVAALRSRAAVDSGRHEAGLRVVIADDSADIRELLSLQLAVMGLDVVAVGEDGEEAVSLVALHAPDVVLLDLSMPRMDGLEAASAIRLQRPDITIVVVSGYAAATMAEVAMQAGANAYLEKGSDLPQRLALALGMQTV